MEEINTNTKAELLDKLLKYVSPSDLRKSLQKTLFAYQMEQDKSFDAEFKKVIEDHYLLIDFLDKLDSEVIA
jgi:hypothetical protein